METKPQAPIKLYRYPLSGHSHRVQLLLEMLSIPYQTFDVDLRAGEHKQPPFLKLNAFGQVPVIDDNGTVIADSAAILTYLAVKYGKGAFLPTDPEGLAAVQRWLGVAAGPLVRGPMSARLFNVFGAKLDLAAAQTAAANLLSVIDAHLAGRGWLATGEVTIADLACYAYIAHAPEGGISLEPYPQVRRWLAQIEALPRFLPMPSSPVGLLAA